MKRAPHGYREDLLTCKIAGWSNWNDRASAAAEGMPRSRTSSWPEVSVRRLLDHMPWKIFIPHNTTTMAANRLAAVNTSKEATRILILRFPAPLPV